MSSSLKGRLRRWLPPALVDLLRPPVRAAETSGLTFVGVFAHLRDVPTLEGVFDERLIGRMVYRSREYLALLAAGRLPYTWHEPLAIIAGLVQRQTGHVRVLDFGGGIGPGYLQLRGSLPHPQSISYLLVDLEQTVDAARQVFADDQAIRFATELPAADERFDIVYANSVLQYIEDYPGMLRRLAGYGAPYLLLGQLATGEFATFATQQVNVPGQILPYWFLGVQEVIELLADSGYDLVSQALMGTVYDQQNLPPTHRAEQMRNMLFQRRSHGITAPPSEIP